MTYATNQELPAIRSAMELAGFDYNDEIEAGKLTKANWDKMDLNGVVIMKVDICGDGDAMINVDHRPTPKEVKSLYAAKFGELEDRWLSVQVTVCRFFPEDGSFPEENHVEMYDFNVLSE